MPKEDEEDRCSSELEATPQKKDHFYAPKDRPRLGLALLFGFQQVMVCVSALLVIPFIVSSEVCPGRDITALRVRLISATFVSSGLSTLVQTGLGVRLALLQGTAFAYVPSIQVFMQLPEYRCNATAEDFVPESVYFQKLAMIQGALLLSSVIPMLIGASGLVGLLTKFIGPLTVSPLMLLLVYQAVPLCVQNISKHWVSIIQAVALFLTILYLAEWRIPVPVFSWRRKGFRLVRTNLFGQYPYLIAIATSWTFCLILTALNLVDERSAARVDKPDSIRVIREAGWFRFPYPAQFGAPEWHAGLFAAFVISALTSVFESVGDYHAAARVSRQRAPPSHAINRGILAEGFGSFISGWLGPGVGMTTHTENIGVIGVTKVASRFTMLLAGVLLIFLGVFTKIGALLSTIPDPLVGGVLASSMAMVSGVAVSNLQSVDMSLSRNMAILGFAMMTGMIVPDYFEKFPVHTGVELIDQLLKVLLTLRMFVGAFTACILDNTVPGATRTQRGLQERGSGGSGEEMDEKQAAHAFENDVYSYPPRIQRWLSSKALISALPFMPKPKYRNRAHRPDRVVPQSMQPSAANDVENPAV